jgi:hypothetical protein
MQKYDNDNNIVDDGKNWIYIGADIHNTDIAKVGLTKNKLASRSTSSHNPGYIVYA